MATQTKMNVYEGMFLFPQSMSANLQEAVDHIKKILDRADSEIISLRKWDERKLAYEINGNKRGVYFLVYFRADPTKMGDIDRAGNLSELLLRSMITRTDHLTQEQIETADGRAQLEDEIKLRAEQGDAAGESSTAGTAVVESKADRETRLAAEKAKQPEESADDGDTPKEDTPKDSTEREPAVVGAKDDSTSE